MKRVWPIWIAAIATGISAAAHAESDWLQEGSANSATVSVSAQVLPPLEISGSQPLQLFNDPGEWLHNDRSGVSNSKEPLVLNSSGSSSTELDISGEPSTAFGITLPGDNIISLSNGRQALQLDGFLSADLKSGQLNLQGNHRLIINADFSLVQSAKLQGLFRGYFPVTVEHN